MSENIEAPAPAESTASAQESTPETNTVDVAASETVEATPEASFSIEDLMAADISDPILTSGENYKGVNYQEVLNELPEDAKKIISNLRSSFSKKTQDLSEQRKLMESQSKELEAQREALISSDFYKNITERAGEEMKALDPYDSASFETRIEQEVAKRMKDMLEPMHAQHELQQREHKLTQFKSEHPDMVDMKQDIAAILMQNQHMNLEQAYWQVKGQKLDKEANTRSNELEQYKTAARNAGLKVGGKSRNGGAGVPKSVLDKDDPVLLYKWLQANKG